jgi:hypothetical protein
MKIGKLTAEHYVWGEGCDGWHLVQKQQFECDPRAHAAEHVRSQTLS